MDCLANRNCAAILFLMKVFERSSENAIPLHGAIYVVGDAPQFVPLSLPHLTIRLLCHTTPRRTLDPSAILCNSINLSFSSTLVFLKRLAIFNSPVQLHPEPNHYDFNTSIPGFHPRRPSFAHLCVSHQGSTSSQRHYSSRLDQCERPRQVWRVHY